MAEAGKAPVDTVPSNVPSDAPRREYDFVLSTGSEKTGAEARRTIRSRVMRTYVQEKTGQTQNMSFVNSDSAVKAGTSSLKGKFRLKKPRKRPEGENSGMTEPPRKHQGPTVPEEEFPVHTATVVPLFSPDEAPNPVVTGWQGNSKASDEVLDGMVSTIPRYRPDTIDPFNVLPVPGGPRLDRLLYYYNSHCNVTSNAVNPTRTWYEFLASHNALFHALLSTVAMCAWRFAGFDTKPDMLYHNNQTLRNISQWLQSLDSAPLDFLIATISMITSSESLQGNYEVSATHIAALKRILFRHDGVTLIQNHDKHDSLQRVLGWACYHHAAVTRAVPFYHVKPSLTGYFPPELLEEAIESSATSMLNIPAYSFEMYDILYRLHCLGISTSRPWAANVDPLAFSNMLYDVEYDMLLLSAKLAPDGDDSICSDESYVASVLLVSGQLFLLIALRMLPLASRTCAILQQRLADALDRDDLFAVWTDQCPIEALLWAISIGVLVASSGSACMELLKKHMEEAVRLLQLTNCDDLERILKCYAWSDHCSIHFERAWNEISIASWIMEA